MPITYMHEKSFPNLSALLCPGLVALGVGSLVTHSLGVAGLGRHLVRGNQPPETNIVIVTHLLTCLGVGVTGVTLGLVDHHTPLVDLTSSLSSLSSPWGHLAVLLVLGLALLAVHGGALLEVPGPHHRHGEHPALLTLDLPGLEHGHLIL